MINIYLPTYFFSFSFLSNYFQSLFLLVSHDSVAIRFICFLLNKLLYIFCFLFLLRYVHVYLYVFAFVVDIFIIFIYKTTSLSLSFFFLTEIQIDISQKYIDSLSDVSTSSTWMFTKTSILTIGWDWVMIWPLA